MSRSPAKLGTRRPFRIGVTIPLQPGVRDPACAVCRGDAVAACGTPVMCTACQLGVKLDTDETTAGRRLADVTRTVAVLASRYAGITFKVDRVPINLL